MSKLALLNGKKAVFENVGNMFNTGEMFQWPIVNNAMENGVLEVLRNNAMSGTDLTKRFEQEFAAWNGVKYALGHNNGTASLQSAMYGVGLGTGDELICPSITYWASCVQALSLGASVSFADIDPETLCIAPVDIERHITPRTKAIMAVHYFGMPADMDPIMEIARRHHLKVIEDISHAQGGLYKGRMVGSIGDAAGCSLMTCKSFGVGEAGIMLTNNLEIYERAVVFGHYDRHVELTHPLLKAGSGIPWGGYKYRMHQMSSIIALEQMKKYPAEMAEIDKAMNYFWDQLDGLPGLRSQRPAKDSGSTKGGWFSPHGIYVSEELGGLSISRFCDAIQAEGVTICSPGGNAPLHLHPLFHCVDVYGAGKPTNIVNLPDGIDIRQPDGSLPVAESIQKKMFYVPWFKHYKPEQIKPYADAFRKVIENYSELLPGDVIAEEVKGNWALSPRKG